MREDKYDVTNDAHGIDELIKGAKMLLPDFDPRCIIRTFAGQRPVVLNNGNDFYIRESEIVKGFTMLPESSPRESLLPLRLLSM